LPYGAASTTATQTEDVDHVIEEYAARHPDAIKAGIELAQSVLVGGGDAAIAAHLLNVPLEDVERVDGKHRSR
jgi:hypothetical protein